MYYVIIFHVKYISTLHVSYIGNYCPGNLDDFTYDLKDDSCTTSMYCIWNIYVSPLCIKIWMVHPEKN